MGEGEGDWRKGLVSELILSPCVLKFLIVRKPFKYLKIPISVSLSISTTLFPLNVLRKAPNMKYFQLSQKNV